MDEETGKKSNGQVNTKGTEWIGKHKRIVWMGKHKQIEWMGKQREVNGCENTKGSSG